MKNRFTIAAIIPTYRRWPHLLATVNQLLEQTRRPDEIIIVDQTPVDEIESSDRDRLEALSRRHGRIIYQLQETPHVYRARNRSARLATAQLLLYLDDDVVLDPRLVEHHVSIMQDEHVDAVVGRVTKNGNARPRRPAPGPEVSPTELAFSFAAFRDDHRVERIAYCVAGNLCLRRSVLFELGGWDEHVLTYGDKDLGLRMYAAGNNVVYDPRPALLHLVAPAGGTRLTDPRAPWSAWQRAVSIHYLAFRHLSGVNYWRYGLLRAARHTFLLRTNAVRPWRWIPEFWGYCRGLAIAWWWARCAAKAPACWLKTPISSCHPGSATTSTGDEVAVTKPSRAGHGTLARQPIADGTS